MTYLGTFSAVLLALVAFKFMEPWIDIARDKLMGWENEKSVENIQKQSMLSFRSYYFQVFIFSLGIGLLAFGAPLVKTGFDSWDSGPLPSVGAGLCVAGVLLIALVFLLSTGKNGQKSDLTQSTD